MTTDEAHYNEEIKVMYENRLITDKKTDVETN